MAGGGVVAPGVAPVVAPGLAGVVAPGVPLVPAAPGVSGVPGVPVVALGAAVPFPVVAGGGVAVPGAGVAVLGAGVAVPDWDPGVVAGAALGFAGVVVVPV